MGGSGGGKGWGGKYVKGGTGWIVDMRVEEMGAWGGWGVQVKL